jgi:hypothetical protein
MVWIVSALAGCSPERAVQAPTASSSPISTVPLAGTQSGSVGITTPVAPSIVSRWVIVESGLDVEFCADGQFVCYVSADDHEQEYWTMEGSYRLLDDKWLEIQLSGEDPVVYEYRLGELWMMLRAPDGAVSRYRRR